MFRSRVRGVGDTLPYSRGRGGVWEKWGKEGRGASPMGAGEKKTPEGKRGLRHGGSGAWLGATRPFGGGMAEREQLLVTGECSSLLCGSWMSPTRSLAVDGCCGR